MSATIPENADLGSENDVTCQQLPRSVRWRLRLGLLMEPENFEKQSVDRSCVDLVDAAPTENQPQSPDLLLLKSIQKTNALRLRLQRSRYEELERENHQFLLSEDENRSNDSADWTNCESWDDYVDVIQKDLKRIPTEHCSVYHEWRKQNVQWKKWRAEFEERVETKKIRSDKEKEEEGCPPVIRCTDGNDVDTDGSLWNWKNWFRPKNKVDDCQKGKTNDSTNQNEEKEDLDIETSIRKRSEVLNQILLAYARAHPELGYRQGMHEVLSLILLALEIDLLESEVKKEKKWWREKVLSPLGLSSPTSGNAKTTDFFCAANTATTRKKSRDDSFRGSIGGGMAGVDFIGSVVVVRLLDPSYIQHDAFSIFECVIAALAPAFDIIPSGDEAMAAILEYAKSERGESPMEAMTSSILAKVRYVAQDEELFSFILCMPVPPQLYFSKWIRLLFGREVARGCTDVLKLWDVFFDLAAETKSLNRPTDAPISTELLHVLETAAASMLLLIRTKLLAPTKARDGSMTGEPDPNEGIGLLMNYSPIENVKSFVDVVSYFLEKQRPQLSPDINGQGCEFIRHHRVDPLRDILPKEKSPAVERRTSYSLGGRSDDARPPQRNRSEPDICLCFGADDDLSISSTISSEERQSQNTESNGCENAEADTGLARRPNRSDILISAMDQEHITKKLESTVSTLMNYFHQNSLAQLRQSSLPALAEGDERLQEDEASSTLLIPDDIWHAMADLELIRKHLSSQESMKSFSGTPWSFLSEY